MKTLGNIIWHVPFLGFLISILVFLVGGLFYITVVGAPIGQGLMQFSKFLMAPFSHEMVSKKDLQADQNKAWKVYGQIVQVIYMILFGWWMWLLGLAQVVGLFVSLVGIPAALVVSKSLGTYFNPVHKVCVPVAVKAELERRKAAVQVDKHLNQKKK